MRQYLLDTSALFKRYLPERGSERMESLFLEHAQIFVSSLTVVELLSNLQRLRSVDKVIDDVQFTNTWASFSLDLATGRIQALGVSAEVFDAANQLLLSRYVTPIDALLIATAESLGDDAITVSADRKLNQLVAEMGLQCLDPLQDDLAEH